MAKRKGRRRSAPSARRSSGAAAIRTVPKVTVAEAQSASKDPDFASEYHYVWGDLKRIAILAAGMFATLAILALVIR